MADDGYTEYYAAKLWGLIPAIYRSLDSEPQAPGPLREMVNRIGAQAAAIRRGVDRMWEDQSIENCDDWLIPYIGDLVATNLVACLDARGQRLDVAKTIYYRRRKGTVGLLEELASDITDADARVVEFFRRLARNRHSFDPPIGLVPFFTASADPTPMAVVEGLAGAYTRTPMGGFADLRQAYGATRTGTAFDEYSYTADFRLGRVSVGWHNIPRLGVFQWWTLSFAVHASTPVEDALHASAYTFDPTGREIQLFAPSTRTQEQFGEHWVSPQEWELPVAIGTPLWQLRPDKLYPVALSVLEGDTAPFVLMGLDRVTVKPELGRFCLKGAAPSMGIVHATYCYGFTAPIGAGPYDQRLSGAPLPSAVTPEAPVVGGGSALHAVTAAMGLQGSAVLQDSLTYDAPADLGGASGFAAIALFGKNGERPVIRWTDPSHSTWILTGAAATTVTPAATLVLQGLLLSGADVILRGHFDSVRIRCSTFDPGAASENASEPYASAVDGVVLAPSRLFIEADVRELIIERCILGPIRTRDGGAIETLRVSDSIVQAIAAAPETPNLFVPDDIYDADALTQRLKSASGAAPTADPLSAYLHSHLSPTGVGVVDSYHPNSVTDGLVHQLVTELNNIIQGPNLYDPKLFGQVGLSNATLNSIAKKPTGNDLISLNRRLLEEGYRTELGLQAVATRIGSVALVRTTVLGSMAVHRLDASECILDDLVYAEDQQHGCVRFSAYADGSVVHQPFESVTVAPRSPLFRSRVFGHWDYARLADNADAAIVVGAVDASILTGAQNASEMGAFCLQKLPLKRRGLAQKFQEFMPIGQVPVWIDVT